MAFGMGKCGDGGGAVAVFVFFMQAALVVVLVVGNTRHGCSLVFR